MISRHRTAVQVFEVLSAVMTSSPEVVRTKNFLSILGFSNLLNSILNFVFGHGLRAFASLGSIDALGVTQAGLLENSFKRKHLVENNISRILGCHPDRFSGKLIQTKCYISYMVSVKKKIEWMSFPIKHSV